MKGHFGKVAVLFLVLAVALAGIGVSYAHWSQTLTIGGTVGTGTLTVGIRDMGTDDPSVWSDGSPRFSLDPTCSPDTPESPCPCNYIPTGTIPPNNPKDVASTDSIQGTPKCIHGGLWYYHNISLVFDNVYPSYCPCVTFAIANCGSVPADLDADDIVFTHTGGMDLTPWIDVVCGSIKIGGQDVTFSWDGQLDPCQVVEFCVCLHFMQDAENASLGPLPQGASMTSEVTFTFTNWNAP